RRRSRGPRPQPASAPDPPAVARAGLVVRRGGPARGVAPVHRLHPRHDAEPGPAAAPGHPRRARQRPRPAGLTVRAAAAESTGLHYYDEAPAERGHAGDPERELLIASIDELTPEDRRHVAALVESLRNRGSQEPADG